MSHIVMYTIYSAELSAFVPWEDGSLADVEEWQECHQVALHSFCAAYQERLADALQDRLDEQICVCVVVVHDTTGYGSGFKLIEGSLEESSFNEVMLEDMVKQVAGEILQDLSEGG